MANVIVKTIWTFIDKQVEKHLKLERVEAAILDDDDKNLYFMWGFQSRRMG